MRWALALATGTAMLSVGAVHSAESTAESGDLGYVGAIAVATPNVTTSGGTGDECGSTFENACSGAGRKDRIQTTSPPSRQPGSGGGGGSVPGSTPVPTSARLQDQPCNYPPDGGFICPYDPPADEGEDPPAVSTVTLAFRANERLPIPEPAVKTAPPRGKKILVQLPTWFWLDKSQWNTRSATARAGEAWSTVNAQAYQLTIDPGDGGDLVTCAAPGLPYDKTADVEDACTYTYPHSGTYTVTVTARWAADWQGSDGNGGTLPSISQSAEFPVHVVQARSELIDGGS